MRIAMIFCIARPACSAETRVNQEEASPFARLSAAHVIESARLQKSEKRLGAAAERLKSVHSNYPGSGEAKVLNERL